MIAAVAMVTLASGCASSDSRLLGHWRSNRALTITTLPHRKQLSPVKRAFFDGIFGRLNLTYTRRYIYSELPPKRTEPPFRQRIPYRVVAFDGDSVTIATKGASSAAESTTEIHFIGSHRYWIPLGTKGGKEYFDRLDK